MTLLVSRQGTALSRGQRERLQLEKSLRSQFLNPVLAQSVQDTLKAVEARKQDGLKPERVWFPDRKKTGTISIAEWMGF